MINELHLHIISLLDTILHYVRKTVGYFDTTYKILHRKNRSRYEDRDNFFREIQSISN